eukprot:15367-Heterococcus_DN1.PRE.2
MATRCRSDKYTKCALRREVKCWLLFATVTCLYEHCLAATPLSIVAKQASKAQRCLECSDISVHIANHNQPLWLWHFCNCRPQSWVAVARRVVRTCRQGCANA